MPAAVLLDVGGVLVVPDPVAVGAVLLDPYDLHVGADFDRVGSVTGISALL